MSRSRPPKTTRGFPARRTFMRTPTVLVDDTERLMSGSTGKSKTLGAGIARIRSHSHPKLSTSSQPAPHHDYSEHELTNIPAPIPDTGLPPPSVDTTTFFKPLVSASPAFVSSSRPYVPSKSTFVPLPSLKTLNLTEIEESASYPLSATYSSTRSITINTTGTGDLGPHAPQLNAPHLSTAAIVALTVSGGLTFFVVFVLVKLVKRPHRRRTPTPSLPILHDGTFLDGKADSEGSPIFGGKERSSPTARARRSTSLWTWTQYNSGIPKPAPMVTVTRSGSQEQHLNADQTAQRDCTGVVNSDVASAQGHDQAPCPFAGYVNSSGLSKTKNPAPLQPVQNAITRAVSRLSTISMSLYPNSPGEYSQVGVDVGLAIDGVTRDELSHLGEPKYKDKTVATSSRTSMMVPGSIKDASALRRSQSLFAYGGMEPISPPDLSSRAQFNGGPGRARIKSTYYTPGAHPRTSVATVNYGKQSFGRGHDGRQAERDRNERADSRRGKDLASALGLTSPVPPSPQPTLYPDDSMSVVGEAKKVILIGRSQKKPVPKAHPHCDSPPSDTAALGSLMMVDFAASKSTASLVNIRPCEAARARGEVTNAKGEEQEKRVEDKPPRVPSPPPIPSLAQMALQHADPEGYADYHSPTYSIYGLYNGDTRKSRMSYGC